MFDNTTFWIMFSIFMSAHFALVLVIANKIIANKNAKIAELESLVIFAYAEVENADNKINSMITNFISNARKMRKAQKTI